VPGGADLDQGRAVVAERLAQRVLQISRLVDPNA
jgi:hypothetical protein